MPDIIYEPLQYVLPWAESGILDIDASNSVVKELGVKTFAPGALNMSKYDGEYVAATKVEDSYMSQVLEQVFLANGVNACR